jgi:hypothetical protein
MTGPARIEDDALQTKPFSYDPETVSTIINHLSWRSAQLTSYATRSIEPFQLQVICQRIERIAAERQQKTGSTLPLTMRDIGGEASLKATLQDFYEQELTELPSGRQRRAVRRLCEEYLISPEGRRLSLEEHEIQRQLKLSGETLGKLVDRRLLRSDQRADNTYYELSHDTLVEPVLVTSRARRKIMAVLAIISGTISAGFGCLFTLVVILGLGSFFFHPSPKAASEWGAALFGFIILTPVAASLLGIAIFSFRSGVRTFRRYRSPALGENQTAFVASVHQDVSQGTLRINLKWKGNVDISAFNLERLGKVLSFGIDSENSGWVIIQPSHRVKAGDVIPLRLRRVSKQVRKPVQVTS